MHDITEIAQKLFNYTEKLNLTNYGSVCVNDIIAASCLHDTGKQYIPEAILNKPARLTKDEFEIMKKHTLLGAKHIRENIPDMCPIKEYAVETALLHHEKIDGTGYPYGTKCIPMYIQIISLADVYSALTSKRCYKDAFSPKEAVEMIKNNECGKFDEKLVHVLELIIEDDEGIDFNEKEMRICNIDDDCCHKPDCMYQQ